MAKKSRVSVTPVNLGQVRQDLDKLKTDVKEALQGEIQDAANRVRDGAAELVNVNTGALRDGITVTVTDNGFGATVGWIDPDMYYAQFQEFGTTNVPANPALTTASEIEAADLPSRVTDVLNGVVK